MNGVEHLLAQLTELGVTLTCSGNDLRVRVPAGALSPALRTELGARKAELIAHLQTASTPPPPFPTLARSPTQRATAPLSFNQRRLWFLDRLEGGGSAFVIMAGWRLKGVLDRPALERALGALTARHELLRSVIRDEGVEPELYILPVAPFSLTVESPAAGSRHDAAVQALLTREAAMPFDLTAAPPLRISLLQLEPRSHVLALAMHHIVSDHWSMGVLINELGMLYALETGASSLRPADPAIQYSDYAVWQRAMFSEERLEPHLRYWREQLSDVVTELALPLDRPRPAERGNAGAMHQFGLAPGTVQKVQACGLRTGATPFMVLLAVYAQVLSRWSGQEEVVIGCPVGNRDRSETHGLVGFFVDTMPLRIDLHGDPDLAELIRRIRTTCLEAFEHQQAPFERIVQAVRPERALNKAPLFQTMFVQQSGASPQLALAGLQIETVPLEAGAPELDLNFFVHLDGDQYRCVMEYDTDLFDQASIAGFCEQFAYVLQHASIDMPVPLSCVELAPPSAPMLPDVEPAQLLLQMIGASALRHADRIAVEEGAIRLSYRELMRKAELLAQRLVAAGVKPGAVVGLGFSSSAALVVAMLATWRAGAGYAVLSPQQPAARRAQMIAAAGISLVVTTASEEAGWPVPVLLSDLSGSSSSTFAQYVAGADAAQGQALAYICFTSGSSGTPKGVAVTHANLANHANAVVQDFGLRESDRVMQFAAVDFDVAAEEIFPALAAGACLVIRAEGATDSIDAFQEHVEQAGLSVLNLPAAFWHEWVRALGHARRAPPACLRLIVTGSDRVFARRWREWQALCTHPIGFRSGYGPTEATITSSFFDPAEQPLPLAADVLPVGRAIANVALEVVDGRGVAVPPGVIGEILISGAGVAQGYIGQPEQTAAVFRPHPMAPAVRSYHSGDLGRRRIDGTLEFIGRKDQQAKVRGYRIELAEIESALMVHPKVREAVVLMRPDSSGSGQLLAVAGCDAELEPGLLRAWLRERLPAYMVPALCITLPRLPRTASGKTDRRALLEMDVTREVPSRHDVVAAAAIATATATEAPLAALFAQVLDRPAVGPCDNFFELGIDSIRSLQVVARARQLQLNLTVRDIFRFQTVRDLMTALESRRQGMRGSKLPEADEGNDGDLQATPIQAWFFEQAGEHRAHYNQSVVLQTPAHVDATALERALEAVVARHPMLRLQLDGQRMRVAASVPGPILRVLDDAEAELPARMAAYEHAQRSMDLRAGRVLHAVLAKPAARLMIAVHHLAIDAYSWSVLLDDLSLAYGQALRGDISLPAPTASYRTWSLKLLELAATPVAQSAVDYFLERFANGGLFVLPADLPAGIAGAAESLPLSLDSDATTVLLQLAPGVFHARVDEILMAALLIGAARIGLKGALHIDLERNGRVDLFDDVDLSGAIGWFTAVQPVLLQWPDGEPDLAEVLMQVCERVRESPCQGLAMGVMRYLSADAGQRTALQSLPAAEILLNYLGRLDIDATSVSGSGGFAVIDEDSGPAQSDAFARSHVIEINAGIRAGCLSGAVSFPAGDGQRERIGAWLREVTAALYDIAAATQRYASSRQDRIEEELSLTPLQQGMVFHSLRDPEIYCNQLCLTLDGALDAGALRRAWEQALQRHSMLRTSFHWRDMPAMRQRVHAEVELPWTVADWRVLDATARAVALDELMRAEVARGFELEQAPLLRLQLLQVGDKRHELVWSSHHLLLDGWSVSVLLAEIFALYRQALSDSQVRLKAAPRFSDYVRWHKRRERGDDIAFWQRSLQGIEEPTSLAFATQARDPVSEEGAIHATELSAARTQAVQKLARRARTTLGTVLQAAWGLLLARCSASRDVVFGVTVSGRPAELDGVEEMIGMLIATVPARLTIPSATRLSDWLAQLQEQHLEREQHAGASLTEIRQAASLPGNQELFHTLLLLQNYPKAQSLAGGGLRLAGVQVRERTNYPLTLVCNAGETLSLALHRDGSIPAAAADRLLAQLGHLLDNMAAHPDWPAARLLALDDLDAQAALMAGRGPVEVIAPAYLPQQIDAWARRAPAAMALCDREHSLSYEALRVGSLRLARRLQALGVGSEKKVALCLPRSLRYVVAVIAILRCGGAFVPLDPAYPAARRRFMLEDSGASLLIADRMCADELQAQAIMQDPDNLFAPFDPASDFEALDEGDFPPPDPLGLAYVIYTSGSTGTPKGVGNTHAGLRSLAHAQRSAFGLLPDARVLQFASLSFDASIWEMTMAFGAGAVLIVPGADTARLGEGLEQFMRNQRISAATLPPTALATLDERCLPGLQTLVVAGESCAPELVLRWGPGRRFYNGYGPSEASVAVSVEAWSDMKENSPGTEQTGQLPIGRPLPNMQLHVLDTDMQLVPPGVVGELYIGGAGLARGYLNRARLTAASFLPDPYGPPGSRLYKTGDRGYRLAGGRVQFVGRNDHQVKLRGFRIELGEIEAALMQHADVRHAAVLVRRHGEDDRRLTAYLETRSPVANDILRDFLGEQLPPHMVPAYFIALESMPLTVSGKIDRKALAAMPENTLQPPTQAEGDYASETERQLAGIWAQVLNVAQVRSVHNFFELGGDSILAIQVVSKANRQGIALTLNQIMDPDSPTLAALAAQVDAADTSAGIGAERAPMPALVTGPVPLTPIQHWFLRQNPPDLHHYNQSFLLEVPAGLDVQALRRALDVVCARHDALRLRFKQVDGVWHQHLSEHATALLEAVPPPADMAGWRALLEQGTADNQTRLDIEQGPLLRLVLYAPPAGAATARLHVVAHHLVIDAVSWRVLLEDLFDAYAQARKATSVGLPHSRASFAQWAAAVERHAVSAQALGELRYWLEQPRNLARLPLLRTDIAATAGAAHSTGFTLDETVTGVLVRELPRSRGAQVQEVLLTALSVALAGLIDPGHEGRGGLNVGIALESHGRDVALEGIDVGGIPGWLTVLAPWTMPLGEHRIDKIREVLKAMPRRGFSFGVLRFLSPDAAVREALAALAVPEIAFNYLGQWDTAWPDSLPVRPAPEADGAGFAPSTPRLYVLEVNAMISGGRLQMDLTFDPRVLPRDFADRLCTGMRDWLQALTQVASAEPSASSEAAETADADVAGYALAPQQAAMLEHAVAYRDSSAYVVQFTARLPAELEVDGFIAAWQTVLSRHLSLRAYFTIGESGKASQHFGEPVPLAWQREDWTALRDADIGAALDAYCRQDRQRGFDLARPPLMRFSLLQATTGHHFVWTYHHVLIDGWSMPVLLSEVMAAYGKQLTPVPAPDFRVFLEWLERQDVTAARNFWRGELAEMKPSRWPAEQGTSCSGSFAEIMWQPQAGTGTRLSTFARRHRLSAPSIFMLAWALVLARHSTADEVCFGVTSVLRPADVDGIEAMVGNLINTPPLRCKIDPEAGFVDACLQLQRRRVATTAHAALAPSEIAQCAGLSGADALFGTALRIQNYPLGDVGRGNTALQVSDVAICDQWHHPFNLEVTPGEQVRLIAVYDAGLVPKAKAEAMLRSYAALLEVLDESALGILMEGMYV